MHSQIQKGRIGKVAINLDKAIKSKRKEYHKAETLEEELTILAQLSELQYKRLKSKGTFLPAPDGNIYYYSKEYDVFFKYWVPTQHPN